MATLRYPNQVFTGASGDTSGASFGAPYVDYIKFTVINSFTSQKDKPDTYVGFLGANANLNTEAKTTKSNGDSVYLYIPSSVQVNYAASYNSVPLGAAGVAAAQALKSSSSIDLASAIQGFAQSAGPEFAFSTVATGLSALKDLTGTGGGQLSASQLSAIAQGKIFNPYMEQIFEAPGFRDHNFSFKLVARNKKEAEDIYKIVRFFKVNMLPSLSGYTATELKTSQQVAPNNPTDPANKDAKPQDNLNFNQFLNAKGVADNRWLTVPNKFDIAFQRFKTQSTGEVSSSNSALSLYKFKTCVLKSCQVNYTPDGQYTAFSPDDSKVGNNALQVPAVQIDLAFSETEIITAADADAGY